MLPPGLGSHVHWDRRLDSRLAGALMGIQAIKGVEVGDGFDAGPRTGFSRTRRDRAGAGRPAPDVRVAAGGTEGGMSTGELLRVRAAMKPIATIPRALRTVDVATGEAAVAHHQRSDVCAVPAAAVVAEAMVALVLAEAAVEKFGGDSVTETRRNKDGYLDVPEAAVTPADGPRVILDRTARRRQDVGRARARRRGGEWRSATPTRTSSRSQAKRCSEIFVDDGEGRFRELEAAAVAAALDDHPGVLALGGGAVTTPATQERLAGHRVVFLDVGLGRGLRPGRPRHAPVRCCSATSAAS